MRAIKRQYYIGNSGYFKNFLNSLDLKIGHNDPIHEELKKYNASLGKSKQNSLINVKWHDPNSYSLFVLYWAR